MNTKGKIAFTVVGICLMFVVVIGVASFSTSTRMNIDFKNAFGYDIATTKVAVTFESMRESLVNIRNNIGAVLPGDPNTIYGNILPWNRTPDVTLQMRLHIIDMYIERIDISISYYQTYKQNGTASLVNDWYSTTMDNIKSNWEDTGTVSGIESIYAIQKYGIGGSLLIYQAPILIFLALVIGGLVTFNEILGEDLDSVYVIKAVKDNIIFECKVKSWTERKAIRVFNDLHSGAKIIGIETSE